MITSASPFIVVDDVKQSLDYYSHVFGGEIHILNKHNGVINHAELRFGTTQLHFSGSYGGRVPKTPGVRIIFNFDAREHLTQVYNQLIADNGQATVELQDTFFGALHGEVKDHMNEIIWVMNCFGK